MAKQRVAADRGKCNNVASFRSPPTRGFPV